MERIFIIGDSFVTTNDYAKGYTPDCYWVEILKSFGMKISVDGAPSRDVQTIIDNWIKLLPHLTEKDYLIVSIPHFRRTRIPVEQKFWDFGSHWGINFVNRFRGTNSYDSRTEIEFWGNSMDRNEFIKMLEPQEIINSSFSSKINYIEIISALKDITRGRSYIFSWDYLEYKSPAIEDRTDLESQIGEWTTLGDDWKRSGGELGFEGDFHWGFEMNRKFATFIKDKIWHTYN
jgi:hypothetical protein